MYAYHPIAAELLNTASDELGQQRAALKVVSFDAQLGASPAPVFLAPMMGEPDDRAPD